MASSFVLLILLSLSFPFFFTSSPVFAHDGEALIVSICNATAYPALCIATVNSDPSSSTADVRSMARIVAGKAINETLLTLNYISQSVTTEDQDYNTVVDECVVDYKSANVSLQDALRTLRAEPFVEDRARVDMRLAEESFGECRDVFTELVTGPEMLPGVQDTIEKLCVIVVGIIDQITTLALNGLLSDGKLRSKV